jgi:nucleotide-binding universal stress UspA family protein
MTEHAVIKKILIPSDLNPGMPESIPYAIALSEWTGAQIYILLTYRLIEDSEETRDNKKVSIREQLNEQAKKKVELIRSNFPMTCESRCEFLIEIGFLSDRIRANIRKHNIDLVIMNQAMGKILELGHELDKGVSLTSFECPVLYVPLNKLAV